MFGDVTGPGRPNIDGGEIRLRMDDREVAVFAKPMADVVSGGIASEKDKVPSGYGHFDD
jgi:hypothetical protein